jgi:hypothetical protein
MKNQNSIVLSFIFFLAFWIGGIKVTMGAEDLSQLWGQIREISPGIYQVSELEPRNIGPEEGGIYVYTMALEDERKIFINLFRLVRFLNKIEDKNLAASEAFDSFDATDSSPQELMEQAAYARLHLFLSYAVNYKTALTLHKKCRLYGRAQEQVSSLQEFLKLYRKNMQEPLTFQNIDFKRFQILSQNSYKKVLEKLFQEQSQIDSRPCRIRPVQSHGVLSKILTKATTTSLMDIIDGQINKMLTGIAGSIETITGHVRRLESLNIVDLVKRTLKLEQDAKNVDINFKLMQKDALLAEKKLVQLERARDNMGEAPTQYHPAIMELQGTLQQGVVGQVEGHWSDLGCKGAGRIREYLENPFELNMVVKKINDCTREKLFQDGGEDEGTLTMKQSQAIGELGRQLEAWSKKYER